MKTGFIAIIGKPNAGKSTLLNSLLGEKISITTPKAQTTRNAILGVYNQDDCQIVFIDTPGIHNPSTHLGTFMNKEAMSQAAGVDVIYYIVDGTKGLTLEDKDILDRIFSYEIPVFLLVNKIDNMDKKTILSRLTFGNQNYKFQELIPISALKKSNFEELMNTTISYLHDDVVYYPTNTKTSMNLDFQISEIIREKIILNTDKEIPHLCAVKIEEVKENESKVFINAVIICNKASHKAILIGKSGSMLKRINENACSDIKHLFNEKRIILSLYVKVQEDWLNKDKQLFDLGYFKGDQDE